MALISILGIDVPLEWVIIVAGVGGTLIFAVLALAYKYFTSQSELSQPSTFVWGVEASGLTRIIELGRVEKMRVISSSSWTEQSISRATTTR